MQQVPSTVELTGLTRGHAWLGLQGCGGEWVVVNPMGLGGTHTHKHRLQYHTSEHGAAAGGVAVAWLRETFIPV